MKLRTRIDRIVALGFGIALAVGFVISQRPRPRSPRIASASAAPARKVDAVDARILEIAVFADAVGTVRSRRQTQIASRVLAEVKEIRRQPGDAVNEGEVLIVLDSMDLKARFEQAEATLRSMGENLNEAKTEFDRKKNLLQKEAVTQQEFDVARFALASITARREAAQKALDEARILLGYATITAPFKGVIFEKHADPGDLATPGKPLLGLYDPAQLRLEALVEEGFIWKLKVKDQIQVRIDSVAGAITGQVSEAVPAVDPFTRTGTVKVDLPTNLDVRPGMFGRARIPVSRRQAIVVPASAVTRRGQLELAFAVRDGPKAGERQARMMIVRAGGPTEPEAGREMVEVMSGLAAGERVIVTGIEDLRDGDPVDVSSAPAGSEGARK